MGSFEFEKLSLLDAYVINGFFAGDIRGGFTKCFEKDIFMSAGINFSLNEAFFSFSQRNVIRGLHFQTNNPQAKLVTVTSGRIWDVIVDMRKASPTYKKWCGVELSADNHKAIFIPKGFAHGFAALEDESTTLYLCDGAYDKETDGGIIYNAPELSIDWHIAREDEIHSQRDLQLMSVDEFEKLAPF